MENNVCPIGNILLATDLQFVTLYENAGYDQECYPLDQHMSDCKMRKDVANKDLEKLTQIGATIQQISEKLSKIISKALTLHNEYIQNQTRTMKQPIFKSYVCRVEEGDGTFQVSHFDIDVMHVNKDRCTVCLHEIVQPRTFRIKNLENDIEISLKEMTLHLIKSHQYFAIPGDFRLDPFKVCKVLNLIEKSGS